MQVSPDSPEFSVDQLLDMEFSDRPLPLLTRDDVIHEGSSHILASREKVGKSTLLRHLCHGWATEGRRVLYITEEFRRSWHKQAGLLGFERGAGHFQLYEGQGRPPAELLDRAKRGPEEIVVLDTVTWLLGIALGSRDQVVEGLKPWLMLCRQDKTVILLSHLVKRGDEIGGSYALGAGVDTLITYREAGSVEGLRLVDVRSRLLAENPPTFAIRKAGSTFLIEDVPGELTLTRPENEVLEVLSTDPVEARTWQQVAEATGFKESKVRTILRHLVKVGLARDVTGNAGSGGRGNAARYIAIEEELEA